jgi:hypothetical protein
MTNPTQPLRVLRRLTVVLPLLFCLLFGLHRAAQSQANSPAAVQNPGPPIEPDVEAQQKRAAEKIDNAKRTQDIKKDTDKLLQLATELKQDVDKTDEHTLSLAVIKKAEEIEKLAHTVKEKMKGQ